MKLLVALALVHSTYAFGQVGHGQSSAESTATAGETWQNMFMRLLAPLPAVSCAATPDCAKYAGCNRADWSLSMTCSAGKCYHGFSDTKCTGIANGKTYQGQTTSHPDTWCWDGRVDEACTSGCIRVAKNAAAPTAGRFTPDDGTFSGVEVTTGAVAPSTGVFCPSGNPHQKAMCRENGRLDNDCRARKRSATCESGYTLTWTTTCGLFGACDYTCTSPDDPKPDDAAAVTPKETYATCLATQCPAAAEWNKIAANSNATEDPRFVTDAAYATATLSRLGGAAVTKCACTKCADSLTLEWALKDQVCPRFTGCTAANADPNSSGKMIKCCANLVTKSENRSKTDPYYPQYKTVVYCRRPDGCKDKAQPLAGIPGLDAQIQKITCAQFKAAYGSCDPAVIVKSKNCNAGCKQYPQFIQSVCPKTCGKCTAAVGAAGPSSN